MSTQHDRRVVGVQPFGGEGLSDTGPKAGGPRYLHRFATEHTVAFPRRWGGRDFSPLPIIAPSY